MTVMNINTDMLSKVQSKSNKWSKRRTLNSMHLFSKNVIAHYTSRSASPILPLLHIFELMKKKTDVLHTGNLTLSSTHL